MPFLAPLVGILVEAGAEGLALDASISAATASIIGGLAGAASSALLSAELNSIGKQKAARDKLGLQATMSAGYPTPRLA